MAVTADCSVHGQIREREAATTLNFCALFFIVVPYYRAWEKPNTSQCRWLQHFYNGRAPRCGGNLVEGVVVRAAFPTHEARGFT